MTHTYNNITAPESFLTEKFSEAVFAYLAQNGFEHFCLKAVLFDMDGVLFDSMPNHAKSWAEVGQRFRLGITAEDAYLHEGRTGASTINSFARRDWGREATTEEIEEIYAEKCRLFNKCEMAQNMPGAERVLNAVRDAGLQILVVTGSGQASLLERLQTHYPGFFNPDHIVSSKDCHHGKPHPDPYLLGLEKAGVRPWEALVVENAPLGVQAAHAAHIFTIAVNTGPLPNETLHDAGANILFPSMTALADEWRG